MTGVRRRGTYLDSCVLIAWFADEKQWSPSILYGIEDIMKAFDAGSLVICTSVITRIELLECKLTEEQRKKVKEFLLRKNFVEIALSGRIAQKAGILRNALFQDKKKISTPDAIHLATASEYLAEVLYTMDGCGKKPGIAELNGNTLIDGLAVKAPEPFEKPPPLIEAINDSIDPKPTEVQRSADGPAKDQAGTQGANGEGNTEEIAEGEDEQAEAAPLTAIQLEPEKKPMPPPPIAAAHKIDPPPVFLVENAKAPTLPPPAATPPPEKS